MSLASSLSPSPTPSASWSPSDPIPGGVVSIRRFGLVLRLAEIDRPTVGDDEMLVRVTAASVTRARAGASRPSHRFDRLRRAAGLPDAALRRVRHTVATQLVPGSNVAPPCHGRRALVGHDVVPPEPPRTSCWG